MPETPVFTSAAVAAPHSLAAQAGQTVLAQGQRHRGDGGDGRLHRGGLSAHERHRRRRVLAGARAGRPGAGHRGLRPGRASRHDPPLPREGLRRDPRAGTRRHGHGGGRGGRLAPRPGAGAGARRPPAPGDALRRRDRSGPSRRRGLALGGTLRATGTRHAPRRAKLCGNLLEGRQALSRRRDPRAAPPRRYPGAARSCGARRLLSRRYRPGDRRRPGAPRCAGHPGGSGGLRGGGAGAPVDPAPRRDALQLPAADPGARRPADPRDLRPAECLRARTHGPLSRADRGDEAGLRDPRPGGHRFRPPAARPRRLPDPGTAGPRGRADRHGSRSPGAPARSGSRRHGLDGRDRQGRACRLLHPVGLLGVRLRHGAARHRHLLAEPGHVVLPRPEGRESPGARSPPLPHADPGARRLRRRPCDELRQHGRRRAAAIPGPDLHPLRRLRDVGGRCRRRAAPALRAHLGRPRSA